MQPKAPLSNDNPTNENAPDLTGRGRSRYLEFDRSAAKRVGRSGREWPCGADSQQPSAIVINRIATLPRQSLDQGEPLLGAL